MGNNGRTLDLANRSGGRRAATVPRWQENRLRPSRPRYRSRSSPGPSAAPRGWTYHSQSSSGAASKGGSTRSRPAEGAKSPVRKAAETAAAPQPSRRERRVAPSRRVDRLATGVARCFRQRRHGSSGQSVGLRSRPQRCRCMATSNSPLSARKALVTESSEGPLLSTGNQRLERRAVLQCSGKARSSLH